MLKMGCRPSICRNDHEHVDEGRAIACDKRNQTECQSGHVHPNSKEASLCDERLGTCVLQCGDKSAKFNVFTVGVGHFTQLGLLAPPMGSKNAIEYKFDDKYKF